MITTPRCKNVPILSKDNTRDSIAMFGETVQMAAGHGIPQSDGSVFAA